LYPAVEKETTAINEATRKWKNPFTSTHPISHWSTCCCLHIG